MDEFLYEANFNVFPDTEQIHFAHTRNFDSPTNHNLHINSYVEIYIYISGETDYIVEDSYFTLNPGDIVVITPLEVHKAVLKNACLYERFYFLIPISVLSSFTTNPLSNIFRPEHSSLVSLPPDTRKQMLDILYKISGLTIEYKQRPEIGLMMYSLTLQFICTLNDHVSLSKDSPDLAKSSGQSTQMLKEILKYIDCNLPVINSIKEIADHFYISTPYLSTMFKQHTGTSLKLYIQTRRIALAKRFLEEGNSVTYACYESGFNDCSYFIKAFKKHNGITPYKYKSKFDLSGGSL